MSVRGWIRVIGAICGTVGLVAASAAGLHGDDEAFNDDGPRGGVESLPSTVAPSRCIRIAASLDSFIDRLGVLDADYEKGIERGRQLWVLRQDRSPTTSSGCYLVVVVDSMARERSDGSLRPGAR